MINSSNFVVGHEQMQVMNVWEIIKIKFTKQDLPVNKDLDGLTDNRSLCSGRWRGNDDLWDLRRPESMKSRSLLRLVGRNSY
jgi:hypothetical protein